MMHSRWTATDVNPALFWILFRWPHPDHIHDACWDGEPYEVDCE